MPRHQLSHDKTGASTENERSTYNKTQALDDLEYMVRVLVQGPGIPRKPVASLPSREVACVAEDEFARS